MSIISDVLEDINAELEYFTRNVRNHYVHFSHLELERNSGIEYLDSQNEENHSSNHRC